MKGFIALSPPVKGVAWMLAQTLTMCCMMLTVRFLAQDGFSGPQMVFFRGLFGLVVLLPWLFHTLRTDPALLAPPELKLVLLRGLIGVAGVIGWFTALTGMSVSDVVAVQFTAPVIMVIGAGLVLGETVGRWRWSAVAIGFIGVMIIIRPGYIPFQPLIIGALVSATSNATVQLITKHIAMRVSGAVLIFYMNILLMTVALAFAWPDWIWPDWRQLLPLLAIGLLGTMGHIFLAWAMRHADASLLGPVDFMRLPIAAGLGWLIFGEYSDLETWVGAGVIFIAVLVITRREAMIAGRASRRPNEGGGET
jgi:drug/metabolite transporter (DMT)-like permease